MYTASHVEFHRRSFSRHSVKVVCLSARIDRSTSNTIIISKLFLVTYRISMSMELHALSSGVHNEDERGKSTLSLLLSFL